MRIYAETNFVLELVLDQEEASDAQTIVDLARGGDVELVLPAVALAEAYSTIHRRAGDRRTLVERIDRELLQVGRSHSLAHEATSVRGLLVRASELVHRRYYEVREELLTCTALIPLDAAVLEEACAVESRNGLIVPDATVLASVVSHLRSRGGTGSIFMTKNSKDFDTPDVRSDLADLGCDILFTVKAALARVRASPGATESDGDGSAS